MRGWLGICWPTVAAILWAGKTTVEVLVWSHPPVLWSSGLGTDSAPVHGEICQSPDGKQYTVGGKGTQKTVQNIQGKNYTLG